MQEITIKIEVPSEMKDKFELAIAKVLKQFERSIKLAMLNEVMSKSELTDKQIDEMSNELKERVAKKHGLQ